MIQSVIAVPSDNVVEIAGAGPAGLAAAITLARAGRRVIVHEQHNTVGARFAGDFQGVENWTTKTDVLHVLHEQGLSTDFHYQPCLSCLAFDTTGRRYEVQSDVPLFYLVERGPGPDTLDTALLRQAIELGVEVRFNSRLRTAGAGGILATGPQAADAISVGYHFETEMANGYWIICDDTLAPKGYAYLLVMNGKGTLKSCMFTDFKREKLYVQRTVEAFERLVGLQMTNPRFHGGSGNFYIPATAYSGEHPQVGEQAGFQDTLWGFGMRLAMTSGVLAAHSVITGENYDALWRKELLPQMEISVVNRAIFSLLGNRGYRLFLLWVSASTDPRRLLRYQYQSVWFKRLLLPFARRRYTSFRHVVSCNHVDCH